MSAGASGGGDEPLLSSLSDTDLYAIGAFFADRYPELCDDVVAEAQAIEDQGLEQWARAQDATLEGASRALLTGLAIRYFRAVAGGTRPAGADR